MAATKLHPAIGKNRYCGPAALSIITGLSTDECAKVLREVSGRRAIYGIGSHYMIQAMQRLGVDHVRRDADTSCDPSCIGIGRTLAVWMTAAPVSRYLLVITGHYVVCDTQSGMVCDNGTVYPLAIDRYRKARKHVRQAWRLV